MAQSKKKSKKPAKKAKVTKRGGKPLPPTKSGWPRHAAGRAMPGATTVACPHCKAKKGAVCRYPDGLSMGKLVHFRRGQREKAVAKQAKAAAVKAKKAKKATPKKKTPAKKTPAKKAAKKAAKKKKPAGADIAPLLRRIEALESTQRDLAFERDTLQARLDEATGTSPDLSAILNVLKPRLDAMRAEQDELRTRQDHLRDHHTESNASEQEWHAQIHATVARLAKRIAAAEHTCPVHGDGSRAGAGEDVPELPTLPVTLEPGETPPVLSAPKPDEAPAQSPRSTTANARYDQLEARVEELLADTDRVKSQIHGFAEIQRILGDLKTEAEAANRKFHGFLDDSTQSLEKELKALVELRNQQTHQLVKKVRDRAEKGIKAFEEHLEKRSAKQ